VCEPLRNYFLASGASCSETTHACHIRSCATQHMASDHTVTIHSSCSETTLQKLRCISSAPNDDHLGCISACYIRLCATQHMASDHAVAIDQLVLRLDLLAGYPRSCATQHTRSYATQHMTSDYADTICSSVPLPTSPPARGGTLLTPTTPSTSARA
jgi:hypothetical protein